MREFGQFIANATVAHSKKGIRIMKVETILKVTKDFQFAMARNSKESLCVLISKSVRSGEVDGLAELIGSKENAEKAIALYVQKANSQTVHEYNLGIAS